MLPQAILSACKTIFVFKRFKMRFLGERAKKFHALTHNLHHKAEMKKTKILIIRTWNEITPHSHCFYCCTQKRENIKHQREAKQMTQWLFFIRFCYAFFLHTYTYFLQHQFYLWHPICNIFFCAYGLMKEKRNCGWCAAAKIFLLYIYVSMKLSREVSPNFIKNI